MAVFPRSQRIAVVALLLCGFTCSWAGAGGLRIFRKKCEISCLEQAAVEIDRLEQQLHQSGTVSIKSPDIWGESRLTKHRQEFEKVLEDKVDEFNLRLNGSIRRSDQAYLANALAIQAALQYSRRTNVSGPETRERILIPGAPTSPTPDTQTAFVNNLTLGTVAGAPANDAASSTPVDRTPIYQVQAGVPETRFGGGFQDSSGNTILGLEPTIELDQLKRYLDHLHEIRRVNEGDDTSDSPGYSLNLVRIPVSIIPGDITREGHGAEVAITCKPHITPELLPRVYRELVINDLVDMLGLSLVHVAERIDEIAYDSTECGPGPFRVRSSWKNFPESQRLYYMVQGDHPTSDIGAVRIGKEGSIVQTAGPQLFPIPLTAADSYLEAFGGELLERSRSPRDFNSNQSPMDAANGNNGNATDEPGSDSKRMAATQFIDAAVQDGFSSNGGNQLASVSSSRNARNPLSASQSQAAFGSKLLMVLGYEFWKTSQTSVDTRHLSDARDFLREELESGYDYLTTPEGANYWQIVPEIEEAIRSNHIDRLVELRAQIPQRYRVWEAGQWKLVDGVPSAVSSAAWWILVESALLNQKLNDDIKRVSLDPNCGCNCYGAQAFYGPDPSPEARQAFIEYVNCRWPIHVFALDPVVQQQNIADQFSMRREMQLALALSFAAGRMNAQSMTRYARRLELDMETIALNKTDVAFGHGSDTFGWRFTPRVQTPPFESNATVVCRDLIWGGPNKDHLRNRWEIEPGLRECVAIVLMPSFIEHVTFHSRGNYFSLTDCCKHLDTRQDLRSSVAQNVRWSEQMQSLDGLLKQIHCESERFLPGEVERVNERVMQLAKSLPLQTVHARVPNENTLGGFEMFSSGVTDLGPELLDYYGEPAIDPGRETTMFLVGKHFSVHETQVIAGHKQCEFSLLSREVLQVRIPAGVRVEERFRPDTNCPERFLDVHLATPYGVTSHLEIPVVEAAATSASKWSWETREIPLTLRYIYKETPDGNGKYFIPNTNIFGREPHEIIITAPPYASLSAATLDLDLQVYFDAERASIEVASYNGPNPVGGRASPFDGIPFDPNRQRFVFAGGRYSTFVTDIVAAIDAQLERIPVNQVPPMLDLRVNARIKTKDRIESDLHILVNLERELP